jgi:hypothetical protein
MAISDLVSALQAVESSVSSRLSVVGVSVPVSSTTTILGVSDAMEDRLLAISDSQTSLTSKISDLETLRSKLLALSTATTQLKNLPATAYQDAIDLSGSDANDDEIEFDDNELNSAGISLKNGDSIRITDNNSAGVSLDTTYYVNVVEDSGDVTVKLYTSRSAALSGGSTGLVDITASGWNTGEGDVLIADVSDSAIEDLFTAFNDAQEFLEEITGDGGSLEGESALSGLGRELTTAMRGLLTSTDFLPLVEDSSDTRALTLDTTALTTLLSTDANTVATLFEGSSGVGAKLQTVASSYAGPSGILNTLISSYQTAARDSDANVSSLLERAQSEQLASVKNISKVAGAITVSTQQIAFLESMFG